MDIILYERTKTTPCMYVRSAKINRPLELRMYILNG